MSEVQMAKTISVASCRCGKITVRLHDEVGEVFAAATMEVAIGLAVAERICVEAEQVREGMKCQGSC
jgi:hypothetical protein